jgi:predicted permease
MQGLGRDLAFALRSVRKHRIFNATAILSLAIGIAATTAIFSVCNSLLIRPIVAVTNASRLVDIGRTDDGRGFDTTSYPNYRDLRERNRAFEDVYAYGIEPEVVSLGTEKGGEPVRGSVVSGNYFHVLGTTPTLGRVFVDADDRAEAPPVVVISNDFWQNRFHADPQILGRTLVLNSHPFNVIGVAAVGFQGTSVLSNDVWFPLARLSQALPRFNDKMLSSRGSLWLMMGGRMKPAVSLKEANADLNVVAGTLARDYPEVNQHRGLTAVHLSRFPGRTDTVAAFMAALMVIVGLVLIIACVNVSGMLLARGAERQHEFATRLALGADRARLVRQLVAEAGLLFCAAAMLGLAFSAWITTALLALLPSLPVALSLDLRIDWRVVLFVCGLGLLSSLVSGLLPAFTTVGHDLLSSLRGTPLSSNQKGRMRHVLLFVQISFSVLLLVVAGMFARGLQKAANVNPGFDQDRVDVVSVDLALGGYNEQTGPLFARELLNRVQGLSSVESASIAVDLPLDGNIMGFGTITALGTRFADAANPLDADGNVIESAYFKTMKLPLIAGREFTVGETPTSPRVAIVNQEFADRVWPGLNPIGREFQLADSPKTETAKGITVIGVASNAKLNSLAEPVRPYYYLPLAQQYESRVSLVVRNRGTGSAVPQVREVIATMNPNLPVTNAMPMRDVTAIEEVPQRIAAGLSGSLGSFVLLLAGLGIYGTVAHSVARRTREIGLRMALGANRQSVVVLVVRRIAVIAAAASVVALAAGVALARVLSAVVYGASSADPVAFGSAVGLLALVVLGAVIVPTRRALSMDPVAALREE